MLMNPGKVVKKLVEFGLYIMTHKGLNYCFLELIIVTRGIILVLLRDSLKIPYK